MNGLQCGRRIQTRNRIGSKDWLGRRSWRFGFGLSFWNRNRYDQFIDHLHLASVLHHQKLATLCERNGSAKVAKVWLHFVQDCLNRTPSEGKDDAHQLELPSFDQLRQAHAWNQLQRNRVSQFHDNQHFFSSHQCVVARHQDAIE